MATNSSPSRADRDARRRSVVLATCCLSVFIAGIDVTIVNVALPSIERALHASVSGLQWTIDAYTLLLCSLAPSLGWLIAFRRLQAVGGSMLNPVAMAIIVNTFTDRAERAKAIGMWGSVAGLSLASGPVLGGLLVSGIGWRSIFWINVPVGLIAIALTQRFVPESRAEQPRRFDPPGQLLVIALLGCLTAGIIEGPRSGWGSAPIVALFGLSAHTAVWYLIVAYLVYSAGAGLVSAPMTNTALSGMPGDQAGVAGAIASTCRQTGAAVGVAVTGAIIASSSAGFVHASHAAWAVLAGCGVMVMLLGTVSTGRWALATAERNGARLAACMSSAPEGAR